MMRRIERSEKNLKEKQDGEAGEGLKRLEIKKEREREGRVKSKGEEGVEGRIRSMEWAIEKEEREKKDELKVFKCLKGVEENIEEEVRKICRELGVEVEIEEMRRVKTGREERGEINSKSEKGRT